MDAPTPDTGSEPVETLAILPKNSREAIRIITEPAVLRPFHRSEALTIAEAALEAGKSARTIREWCLLHDIGRRIGGRRAVSHVARQMLLDRNKHALELYLRGDRISEAVLSYYLQLGIRLPRRAIIES
jgi:hypothetical protein